MRALGAVEAGGFVIGAVGRRIGEWVGDFGKLAVFARVGCVDESKPEGCRRSEDYVAGGGKVSH